MYWNSVSKLSKPLSGNCGWCNSNIEITHIYHRLDYFTGIITEEGWYIGICPKCGKPIFIDAKRFFSGCSEYLDFHFYPPLGTFLDYDDKALENETLDNLYKQLFKCKQFNIKDGFSMLLRSFLYYFCDLSKRAMENTTDFIHKSNKVENASEMNFSECVSWIVENRLVSRDFDNYLDEFRKNGNESTHIQLKGDEYNMDQQFKILQTIIDSNPTIFKKVK